jgi:hypothetical protein
MDIESLKNMNINEKYKFIMDVLKTKNDSIKAFKENTITRLQTILDIIDMTLLSNKDLNQPIETSDIKLEEKLEEKYPKDCQEIVNKYNELQEKHNELINKLNERNELVKQQEDIINKIILDLQNIDNNFTDVNNKVTEIETLVNPKKGGSSRKKRHLKKNKHATKRRKH